MRTPLWKERDRLDWLEAQQSQAGMNAPQKPTPPGIIVFREGTVPERAKSQGATSLLQWAIAIAIAILFAAVLVGQARGEDALDVVNKQRATRGLFPLQRDDGLSIAAEKAAQWRAARGVHGHCPNDFVYVPKGYHADTAGCAAWDEGFGACELYSTKYRYAGAAWVRRGGLNFCHVYYRR